MSTTNLTSPLSITDHQLLLISGPDSVKFLQGQVTSDVSLLAPEGSQSLTTLGAHCTPKGRMLFSFRACQIDDSTIALSIYTDLLPKALAALGKYAVFSKVELKGNVEDYRIIGFQNEIPEELAQHFPNLPSEVNQAVHNEAGTVICIAENLFELWLKTNIEAPQYSEDNNLWTQIAIENGLGEVRPETSEEFIPQMLNYQVVANAISFKKGCYTGQEVVARMQYLGKLKRRMFRFKVESTDTIVPGMPLYTEGSSQSIGNLVTCANTDNQWQVLAVVTEVAAQADAVYLDEQYQSKLLALPLPYAITKE